MRGYEASRLVLYGPLFDEVKHLLMLLGGAFFIGRFTVIATLPACS
jgi:hypothetical protein